MTRVAVNFNGISIAYLLGFVNACMGCAMAFGLELNDAQRASIVVLVNTGLVLAVHLGHRVGEAAMNDATHELGKAKIDTAATPPKGE